MSAEGLLAELARRGIALSLLPDGRLRYAPKSTCRDLLPQMQQHRAALVQAALPSKPSHDEGARVADALKMRLSEFARAGLLLAVRLPQLGEVVWLASDNTPFATDALGHYQGQVVYRACEWRRLYALRARGELDDHALGLIHEMKKIFGGELLDDEM